jgi:hypothetical protein
MRKKAGVPLAGKEPAFPEKPLFGADPELYY